MLVFKDQGVRCTGNMNENLLRHSDQVIVEPRNLLGRHNLVQIPVDQKRRRYDLRRLDFVPGIPERIAIKRWRSSDATPPPCAAGGIESEHEPIDVVADEWRVLIRAPHLPIPRVVKIVHPEDGRRDSGLRQR